MKNSKMRRGTHTMVQGSPETSFVCEHCHRLISTTAPGTHHRNHCPLCLCGLHVDIRTGDRLSACRGVMEPITVWVKSNGEWAIVHRCQKCGVIRTNRIAGDDNELLLISLALRPLAQPPFPLDSVSIAGAIETREG
jgi:hypothetical protein